MEKGNHQKNRGCSPYRNQDLRTVEIRTTNETTKLSKNREKVQNRKLPTGFVTPEIYMGHVQCLRNVFEEITPREQVAVREGECKTKMYGSLREKKRPVTRDLPISPGVHGPVYSQVFNPLKKQFLEKQCQHATFSNIVNSAVQHTVPLPQDMKRECTENNGPCTDTSIFQSATRNQEEGDANSKHTRSHLQDRHLPSSIRVSSTECTTNNPSITLRSPKGWKNENRVLKSPKAIIAQCLDPKVIHDSSLLPQKLEAFYFSPVKAEPWHNTSASHRPEDADRPNNNWSVNDTDVSDEQFKSSSSVDLVQDVNNHSFNDEVIRSKERKRECVSPIIIKKTQLVDLQYKDSGQSKNRKSRTNNFTVREEQTSETKNELKTHNVSLRFAPKLNPYQENTEPDQNEKLHKNTRSSLAPRKQYRNIHINPSNDNITEEEKKSKARCVQNISVIIDKRERETDGSRGTLVILAEDTHIREKELLTRSSSTLTAVKEIKNKPLEETSLRPYSNFDDKNDIGGDEILENKTMEQITLDQTAYENICIEMSPKYNPKHNNHSTLCTEQYLSEIINETEMPAEDVMDHTLAEINQEGNVKDSYRKIIVEKLTAQKRHESEEAVVGIPAVVPNTGTFENTQVIQTSILMRQDENIMVLQESGDVEKINSNIRLQPDEDVGKESMTSDVTSQVHNVVSVVSTKHKQAENLLNQQDENENYEAKGEGVKLSQSITVQRKELLNGEQAGDIRDLAALIEKATENTTEYLLDNDTDKGTGLINTSNHALLMASLNKEAIGGEIIQSVGDDICNMADHSSDVNNHLGNITVIVSTDFPVVDDSLQAHQDEVEQAAYSTNEKSININAIAQPSKDDTNQVTCINNQHKSVINMPANNVSSTKHELVGDINILTFTSETEQAVNITKVSDGHNKITSTFHDSSETVNTQPVVENVDQTQEDCDVITNHCRDRIDKAADSINAVNDTAVIASPEKESMAIQPAGVVIYQNTDTLAATATKELSETVSVQHDTIQESMVTENTGNAILINTSNSQKSVNRRDDANAISDVSSNHKGDFDISANTEPNFREFLKLGDKNSSQVEMTGVNENLILTDHSRTVMPSEIPCINTSEITHLAQQTKNCRHIETDPCVVSFDHEETMRNDSVPQLKLPSMETIEDVAIRSERVSQVLADEEPEVSENMEVWVNRLRQLESPENLRLPRAQRHHRASPLSMFATLPPIQEDQGSPTNIHTNIMCRLQEENDEPEKSIPGKSGLSHPGVDTKNNMAESDKPYSWERSTLTPSNKESPLEMMRKHSGDAVSRSTAYKALITQNLSQRQGSIIGSLLLSDHLDKKTETSEGKVYSRLESSFLLSSYSKGKKDPHGKGENTSTSGDDNNELPPKESLDNPQFQDTDESCTEQPDKTAAGPVTIDIPISKPYIPITSQPKDLPDIWLNTKKEHGKLNPRPGKIILFSEPGFRGQKYEIYSDLGNTSSWELQQSMSVRVIRGGWLLYEKPLYRGKRLMLLEGDMDLSCPWGTNTEDDTRLKKSWIGSLRHVVKDFQVPEISLFLEENGEGEKVKIVGPAPDTRVNGQPIKTESIIVHSGLWLLYSKPFFEGDPYILESGGYPNKKAWGGLDSDLCSLQPARIGGPTVEKPNEPKLHIFQLPGFEGQVWEVTRDLHSVHGEPNSNGERLTSVGSLKVLGGCWVAYEKEGFRGHQYLLEEGEFRDWSHWGGYNKELGSIRLIRTDFSEPEIVLYEDPGSSEGPCLRLSETLADVEVAKYRTKTGSIHVLSGVWVAYENVDFSGAQYILEKGAYHSFQDWGAENRKISSVQPVIQVGGHNLHFLSKIQLFSKPNFHGDCLTCEEDCVSLPESFSPQSCRVEGGSWILYEGEDCSGEQYIVSEGDYPTYTAMGCLTICALRSLRKVPFYFSVPSISLHGLERFEGKELEFSGEVRSLQGEGYNNHVLSVRVESGIWVVYEHSDFRGKQWLLERTQIPNWLLYSGLQRIGSLCPIRQRRVYFRLKNHALGLFLCVPESSEDMKASRVLLTKPKEGCCDLWYYEEGCIKNQVAPHMSLQMIGQSCAGTKVVLWAEGRKPIQTWSLDHLGYIRSHTFQGMCLDVKGGQSYDSDHVVVWEVEEDRPTQRWDIEVY
ncbi:beta/gamma crystallin domain-containing protein 2 isoform X2 [Spea bombifrons]|nr:beta/gamma crystallin domain-containing protein 2 isoform X2 [Spea bombifrons]